MVACVTLRAHREFHGFIEEASRVVSQRWGKGQSVRLSCFQAHVLMLLIVAVCSGLYVDCHGQAHAEQWVELGYAITTK
jgi:hypothetical protein